MKGHIVELLRGLQTRQGIAYLFISQDLRVGALAHDLLMKSGKIFETGVDRGVTTASEHPLMAAAFDLAAFSS